MGPAIGLTAYTAPITWNGWEARAAFTPMSYVNAVVQAGGRPFLVLAACAEAAETLAHVDGLVFIGGPDIDPALYRAARHPEVGQTDLCQDRAELLLMTEALRLRMPLLAICRGMELLNLALGGTLVQHLPDLVGHDGHSAPPNEFAVHDVIMRGLPGGGLEGRRAVQSHHHQAVDRLSPQLTATAWAYDGTIEAVQHRTLPCVLGVQWHPEIEPDLTLFESLVVAARTWRDGGAATPRQYDAA
jgi:putative glutamine amidotransferase